MGESSFVLAKDAKLTALDKGRIVQIILELILPIYANTTDAVCSQPVIHGKSRSLPNGLQADVWHFARLSSDAKLSNVLAVMYADRCTMKSGLFSVNEGYYGLVSSVRMGQDDWELPNTEDDDGQHTENQIVQGDKLLKAGELILARRRKVIGATEGLGVVVNANVAAEHSKDAEDEGPHEKDLRIFRKGTAIRDPLVDCIVNLGKLHEMFNFNKFFD